MFRFFLIESKKKKIVLISRLKKLQENIRSLAVTKLRMQSVCACELLADSGNSVFFASFDQDRCGVNSFAAKFVFC